MTDEALIAEIAVWPNFFLMNIFFALKGSKLFIIISYFFLKLDLLSFPFTWFLACMDLSIGANN